eukprot:5908020-Pleurochrysis_carterae.AAC.1
MPPSHGRLTLSGAHCASRPAPVRSVRFPYALPGPWLRGAHVRALADARRSSVPQAHAPLLA